MILAQAASLQSTAEIFTIDFVFFTIASRLAMPMRGPCLRFGVRKILLVVAATTVTAALLVGSLRVFGARQRVVRLPGGVAADDMARHGEPLVRPRLPTCYHSLRGFERDGRLYEMLGIRFFKRLLRRGPLSVFNPDLHIPKEPTPDRVAHLDQRMRDAEASHFILLVASVGVVVHAAVRGWVAAACWTFVFDILVNGYPVMLQRYNRALLARRFTPAPPTV